MATVTKGSTTMSRHATRIPILILLICAVLVICLRHRVGDDDSVKPDSANPDPTKADTPKTDATSAEALVRKAYADKVRESYNFAFDKSKISLPGNAAV